MLIHRGAVEPWTRFPKSASYGLDVMARTASVVLTLALLSAPVFGWPFVRPPVREGSSTAARVMSGIMLALLTLAGTVFMLVPFNQARHLAEGYPPLSQLDLTEGAVVRVEPCHRTGKGGVYLPIIVQTAAGQHRMGLRCELEPTLRHGAWPHHLAAYRGLRPFDDAIRQVEIDGLVVQSYADFASVDRRRAPFTLVGETMLVAAAWTLVLGFAACRRRR